MPTQVTLDASLRTHLAVQNQMTPDPWKIISLDFAEDEEGAREPYLRIDDIAIHVSINNGMIGCWQHVRQIQYLFVLDFHVDPNLCFQFGTSHQEFSYINDPISGECRPGGGTFCPRTSVSVELTCRQRRARICVLTQSMIKSNGVAHLIRHLGLGAKRIEQQGHRRG